MKLVKLSSLFILAITFLSFKTNECISTSSIAPLQQIFSSVIWKTDNVDLGEIPQGKPVIFEFEFTNNSDKAVIVMNASASCGCTIADYPKQPIAVGKSAKISAVYNAAALGVFLKTITVQLQNEEPKVLLFKGTVI